MNPIILVLFFDLMEDVGGKQVTWSVGYHQGLSLLRLRSSSSRANLALNEPH